MKQPAPWARALGPDSRCSILNMRSRSPVPGLHRQIHKHRLLSARTTTASHAHLSLRFLSSAGLTRWRPCGSSAACQVRTVGKDARKKAVDDRWSDARSYSLGRRPLLFARAWRLSWRVNRTWRLLPKLRMAMRRSSKSGPTLHYGRTCEGPRQEFSRKTGRQRSNTRRDDWTETRNHRSLGPSKEGFAKSAFWGFDVLRISVA